MKHIIRELITIANDLQGYECGYRMTTDEAVERLKDLHRYAEGLGEDIIDHLEQLDDKIVRVYNDVEEGCDSDRILEKIDDLESIVDDMKDFLK